MMRILNTGTEYKIKKTFIKKIGKHNLSWIKNQEIKMLKDKCHEILQEGGPHLASHMWGVTASSTKRGTRRGQAAAPPVYRGVGCGAAYPDIGSGSRSGGGGVNVVIKRDCVMK